MICPWYSSKQLAHRVDKDSECDEMLFNARLLLHLLCLFCAAGNFSIFPTWSTRPTPGCGASSTSLWVERNHFWQLYVTCHDSLSETILQDTLECRQYHGWQRNCWTDKVKERISPSRPDLLTTGSHRKDWKRFSAEPSFTSL